MELILLLKAAVLGIIEGATEFIPVSSTGHLILAQDWLNFTGEKENSFIIFIQLGAILAVVWLYRLKFLDLAINWRKEYKARRLIMNIILGTIPAVIIGLPTEDWIESHLFKPYFVALALIVGGLAILLVEKSRRRTTVDTVDDIPVNRALGVGALQVLAIIFPGISRSGATIIGGLTLGLSRKAATEFSFFLAVPAMFGASFIKLLGVADVLSPADAPLFFVGFVVSFLVALLVIKGLIVFISRNSFASFAWYRIIFGIILTLIYWDFLQGF